CSRYGCNFKLMSV
ncbi:hypothetical protein VCHC17A1_1432B, partial [Vibrio cholerae HC-17A1]